MPTVAVTVAVYNEQSLIEQLLDALLQQTTLPDEVIVVDDGSTDATGELVRSRARREPRIRYFRQDNAGPASARNRAFREATSEICCYTDGDCVPDREWIERLIRPFADPAVGAAAGTYRTLNRQSLLAEFVGLEIAWRYRNAGESVDCHGSYNLAVRRALLEQVGGFDESYRYPSGEDFDLTYRIARRSRIAFVRDATVGHEHPEALGSYLRLQGRRAFDRVRLYHHHPEMRASDSYTSWVEKYQVLASGLLLCSPILLLLGARVALPVAAVIAAFLLATACLPFAWIARRSLRAAIVAVPVRLIRNFAWGAGVALGKATSLFVPGARPSGLRTG